MKNTFFFFLFINSFSMVYSQTRIINGGELKKIKIEGYKSVDFFIVPNNARLFNAPKGKFRSIAFYKLTFDEKNNRIINLTPKPLSNIKVEKIDKTTFCSPQKEDGSSPKYTIDEIKKCFNILKNDKSLNWKNQDGCDDRASRGRIKLDSLGYISSKTFALPTFWNTCYGGKYPIWAYHVANVMHCNDNNFYVLDPHVVPHNPVLLENWKDTITFNKTDCEKFSLYRNNCVVRHPISSGGNPTIVCFCKEIPK